MDINTLPLTWYCPSCTNKPTPTKNKQSNAINTEHKSATLQKTNTNDASTKGNSNQAGVRSAGKNTIYQSPANGNAIYCKQPTSKCTISHCPNYNTVCLDHGKMVRIEDTNDAETERGEKYMGVQSSSGKQQSSKTTSNSVQKKPSGQGSSSNQPSQQQLSVQEKPTTTTREELVTRKRAPPKEKELDVATPSFRTVTVPDGVLPGEIFHVLLGKGKVIGATCPKGVKAGDKLIILEPDTLEPPISPEEIAKMNEDQFTRGIFEDSSTIDSSIVAGVFWKVLWPALKSEGWTYTRQVHYNFGAMTVYIPGRQYVNKSKNILNVHYFETIVGIRKLIASLPKYTKAVKAFDAEIVKKKEIEQNKKRVTRKKRRADIQQIAQLDAWKNLGDREHISIGSQYQVRTLPRAGSHVPEERDGYYVEGSSQEQIWNASSSLAATPILTPSTWYDVAKDPNFLIQFHNAIMKSKKQMRDLALAINKPVNFCLWYYYHKYKPNKELYESLKKMMSDLKELGNSDECAICEEGGKLICCETCPDSVSDMMLIWIYIFMTLSSRVHVLVVQYHLNCLDMDASEVEGIEKWSCPGCVRKRKLQLSPPKSPSKRHKIGSENSNSSTTALRDEIMHSGENLLPSLEMPLIEAEDGGTTENSVCTGEKNDTIDHKEKNSAVRQDSVKARALAALKDAASDVLSDDDYSDGARG